MGVNKRELKGLFHFLINYSLDIYTNEKGEKRVGNHYDYRPV